MRVKILIYMISLSFFGGQAFSQQKEDILKLETYAKVYFSALKTGNIPDTLTPSFDELKALITDHDIASIEREEITKTVQSLENRLKSDLESARRQLEAASMDISKLVFRNHIFSIKRKNQGIFDFPMATLQILFQEEGDTALYKIYILDMYFMQKRWTYTGTLLAATQQTSLVNCSYSTDSICHKIRSEYLEYLKANKPDPLRQELLANEVRTLLSIHDANDMGQVYPWGPSLSGLDSGFELKEPKNVYIDEENPPAIEFVETEFDFGKIKQGDIVTHAFKFKNTGKSELVIVDARASCGCTLPSIPKDPIAVGETGELTVEFNSSKKSGQIRKAIRITANTYPNQSHLVYINAEVIE